MTSATIQPIISSALSSVLLNSYIKIRSRDQWGLAMTIIESLDIRFLGGRRGFALPYEEDGKTRQRLHFVAGNDSDQVMQPLTGNVRICAFHGNTEWSMDSMKVLSPALHREYRLRGWNEFLWAVHASLGIPGKPDAWNLLKNLIAKELGPRSDGPDRTPIHEQIDKILSSLTSIA